MNIDKEIGGTGSKAMASIASTSGQTRGKLAFALFSAPVTQRVAGSWSSCCPLVEAMLAIALLLAPLPRGIQAQFRYISEIIPQRLSAILKTERCYPRLSGSAQEED